VPPEPPGLEEAVHPFDFERRGRLVAQGKDVCPDRLRRPAGECGVALGADEEDARIARRVVHRQDLRREFQVNAN